MMKRELRAGVARESISPPKGIYLIGYGGRAKGNRGIHDSLTATALMFELGDVRVALVACDLLCINELIVDRIRTALAGVASVIIACSHTHSGPIAYADTHFDRFRRAYIDLLVERIVLAVQRAGRLLKPVTLAWETTTADIAINRRARQADGTIAIGQNPDGIVDRTVNILRVLKLNGKSLATVVNFACHGTVLGPQNLLASADWIGAMRDKVEADVGGMTLFLQGATANLNPIRNSLDAADVAWDAVDALGHTVATAVIAACHHMPAPIVIDRLALSQTDVYMPLDAKATTSKPPRTYRAMLAKEVGLPKFLAFVMDIILNRRYPWRSRLTIIDDVWHVPMRIGALRLGEVVLLTMGAEVFAEIGVSLKAVSPTSHTMFASVTDGCVGYLPTPEAQVQGGYEVETAPFFYRYPGKFTHGVAMLAQQAIEKLLQNLLSQ